MRNFLLAGVAASALLPATVLAQTAAAPPPAATTAPPQDVIVTASPFGHERDDTPAIAARVDREKILMSGGSSIADALAEVPGIAASGFAAGASRPIIRGMDATRVRLLEDGVSSSDVSDIGPDHGVPIDPLAARSVEVVRGAATLRYGSQAIGGVVNAINDRVPMSLPDRPFSGELTGSYGSVSDTWQGSALADVKAGNLALHADGFVRDAGDYDTPLGTQQNSFFRGHGASLGGSYFIGGGDSHVGAAITQYNAKYGIPSDSTYIDMKQTKVITRSSFDLGTGALKTLKLDGSYADYSHAEKEPDGTVDTVFNNKEYNGRAELLFNRIGAIEHTAIGVEYMHRDFSAVGEDSAYLFPATTQTVAGYIFTDTPVAARLHLEASGRVERVDVRGTPASNVFTRNSFTPVSGAIGALYHAGDAVKLGLTFASTGRAPGITELFARGGHDGPQTYETGDPRLKIERANSLEGSLRIRAGRLSFDGSIYSTWFHNYIYGDLTGRMCDEDGVCAIGGDGDLKELFYRQQGAHFRGLEGEARYQLVKTYHGSFVAKLLGDYTRATLENGGNVPRIPPYRIGGGVAWQGDRIDAGLTLIRVGRQNRFGAFDTPTPGYFSLNEQVAWRPFKSHPGIEVAVVGQNLTNDVQRNAAALNKDDVVMPGRNIRLVLKVATF